MIRAIVFDCFGVILTDALSVICADVEERDPHAAIKIRSLIHAANKGIIDPEESSQRVSQLLGVSIDDYRNQIRNGELRDQKLLDFIKTLRPKYKTAILSNITQGGLQRRFPDDELSQYFDVVVASGEIGFAKPEKQAYQITAERLGVNLAECVFTDDRQPYCDAAVEAGMSALLYTDFPRFRKELQSVLAQPKQLP